MIDGTLGGPAGYAGAVLVRRRIVTALLAVLAIVAVVLAIRSWSEDDADRARGAVERFGNAVAAKDYRTICEDLLAPDLRQRLAAIGLPCERALATGLGEVRDPRVTIRSVAVADDRASVAIETAAAGQPSSRDVLQLRLVDDEWRITSLGGGATTVAGSGGAPAATTATAPTPPGGTSTTGTVALPPPDAPPNGFETTTTPAGRPLTAAQRRREQRRQRRLRRLAREAMREQGSRDVTPR